METTNILLLSIVIFLAAIMYSSVGHGGASAYMAAMALFGLTPAIMKPTASRNNPSGKEFINNEEVVKLANNDNATSSNNENKISSKLVPRAKIWIEVNDKVIFGGGRMELFEAIEECGSIRQASTKLGMSYRAAWGKIKATEDRLGIKLMEKHTGGPQSGAQLTEDAKKMLASYKQFREESEKAIHKIFVSNFKDFLE